MLGQFSVFSRTDVQTHVATALCFPFTYHFFEWQVFHFGEILGDSHLDCASCEKKNACLIKILRPTI